MVGVKRIEELEGRYAKRAVERWMTHGNIWILGQEFSNIISEHRLSITSFNIKCVVNGEQLKSASTGNLLYLHHHYVAALLNDLYGIQSRSGCSCAAPLAFQLFQYNPQESEIIAKLAEKDGLHVSSIRTIIYAIRRFAACEIDVD
jgi:selenocysteine lyase/cysteine desulfurase